MLQKFYLKLLNLKHISAPNLSHVLFIINLQELPCRFGNIYNQKCRQANHIEIEFLNINKQSQTSLGDLWHWFFLPSLDVIKLAVSLKTWAPEITYLQWKKAYHSYLKLAVHPAFQWILCFTFFFCSGGYKCWIDSENSLWFTLLSISVKIQEYCLVGIQNSILVI